MKWIICSTNSQNRKRGAQVLATIVDIGSQTDEAYWADWKPHIIHIYESSVDNFMRRVEQRTDFKRVVKFLMVQFMYIFCISLRSSFKKKPLPFADWPPTGHDYTDS